jgi:hypothetical protein
VGKEHLRIEFVGLTNRLFRLQMAALITTVLCSMAYPSVYAFVESDSERKPIR